MTAEKVFDIWAPHGAVWSPWVKPVAFARPNLRLRPEGLAPVGLHIPLSPPDGRTAVVFDVPGASGVWLGLDAAHQGYRPVPLYNAVPGGVEQTAAVDMWEIISALHEAAPRLAELKLPATAPPAFLLDSNRRTGARAVSPGQFDNRSVSFPTDFPGPNTLRSSGISRAILVQPGDRFDPQPDLAHTLRRWQDIGILVSAIALGLGGEPVPIKVRQPPWYRSVWHRLVVSLGLRRNALGGFGGTLPEPGSGG